MLQVEYSAILSTFIKLPIVIKTFVLPILTVNMCKTATLKKTKIGLQDHLSLDVCQKHCRMPHSAILSTFIKLQIVIKIFVLSTFEWPFYTGFTVDNVDVDPDQ